MSIIIKFYFFFPSIINAELHSKLTMLNIVNYAKIDLWPKSFMF